MSGPLFPIQQVRMKSKLPGRKIFLSWMALFWALIKYVLFLSLEQLERPECSSISDGYTLSIAFACLLEIVKSLDVLVQESNGSSNGGDVIGWIEPEVPGTPIETGVGTDTIRAAAKEGVENDKGG